MPSLDPHAGRRVLLKELIESRPSVVPLEEDSERGEDPPFKLEQNVRVVYMTPLMGVLNAFAQGYRRQSIRGLAQEEDRLLQGDQAWH